MAHNAGAAKYIKFPGALKTTNDTLQKATSHYVALIMDFPFAAHGQISRRKICNSMYEDGTR